MELFINKNLSFKPTYITKNNNEYEVLGHEISINNKKYLNSFSIKNNVIKIENVNQKIKISNATLNDINTNLSTLSFSDLLFVTEYKTLQVTDTNLIEISKPTLLLKKDVVVNQFKINKLLKNIKYNVNNIVLTNNTVYLKGLKIKINIETPVKMKFSKQYDIDFMLTNNDEIIV